MTEAYEAFDRGSLGTMGGRISLVVSVAELVSHYSVSLDLRLM